MRHKLAALLALFLLPSTVPAEQPVSKLWKYSAAVLAASNVADVATSVGRYETNPVLGRGPFGRRAAVIKASICLSNLAVQAIILRRHPSAGKPAAAMNFGMAAIVGSIAIRNTKQPTVPHYMAAAP